MAYNSVFHDLCDSHPAGRLVLRSVDTELIEVVNAGQVIGGITAVPIPGLRIGPFAYSVTYVGWAHDWAADNPEGAYLPISLGTNDDPNALIAEIERRAQEAQVA